MLAHIHPEATIAPPRGNLIARLVHRLLAADARYRDRQRLRAMPDGRLADMGLTRADLRRAFGRGIDATDRPHDPGQGW